MNSSLTGESSIINLSFKPPALIDNTNMSNKEQASLEGIVSERINENDLISMSPDSVSNNNNNKKISKINHKLKKNSSNIQLPVVLMSVSAKFNR